MLKNIKMTRGKKDSTGVYKRPIPPREEETKSHIVGRKKIGEHE
jgi:hypothetical protein